ncbi:uncharacterized protein FOMMEDRAFT_85043 [Fomitiporia mediterranea MF3/22]|uniref:uncharacterized protein n=1 Tax=Fomitiporia mediterranea (strain MF3/22) TaxID=694068 RepID=UPI0004409AC7|nr:uncharacterized protein FOMMEDRAFT_85043 [Fomitiporia mediterranea MF3/22]EJD03308.1 hypothetical protein FOMMEDRAFT_85043 [Fomitiporia mediterranea MF3/22]
MAGQYTPTPWPYFLVRLLFKFVLKIFYGSIVVENTHFIPGNGEPCIICANHSNSLTDAVLLVGTIPSEKRNFIRLTAKATQFGRKTFTSWLIEAAGTVPIKRRKDSPDVAVDNSEVMDNLKKVLEQGDAVCLFPEGASRFHPTIAPLKTGVARLISDVLTRKKDDPTFRIHLLTCSITYMHRQHFRSDILITFHPPTPFTPKANPELIAPVDFGHIRTLTNRMQQQLSAGTFDAPSWDIVRCAKLSARMYAPLGTHMALGDYVRVCRAFVEAFKWAEAEGHIEGAATSGSEEEDEDLVRKRCAFVNSLRRDLKDYQDQLARLGIKDDRIRRPVSRPIILWRILVRLAMTAGLFLISLPGLFLWLPIFVATQYASARMVRTGPVWDTWDEIAQTKLVTGLAAGCAVWALAVLLTLPIAFITGPVIPVIMWFTLRWLEDTIAASRALRALARLLLLGKPRLRALYATRQELYARLMVLAVDYLKLPPDPETHFSESGGREKGRVRSRWEGKVKYFSVKRRRKRDWNETLKLYDTVDYPEDSF